MQSIATKTALYGHYIVIETQMSLHVEIPFQDNTG